MADLAPLNDLEQLVVLAVARLGGEAYGVPIRQVIVERGQRAVSMAAVYAALDRLEARGLLTHSLSAPTPERGGRRKKHFSVTATGEDAVRDARRTLERMWDGVVFDDADRRSA